MTEAKIGGTFELAARRIARKEAERFFLSMNSAGGRLIPSARSLNLLAEMDQTMVVQLVAEGMKQGESRAYVDEINRLGVKGRAEILKKALRLEGAPIR